MKTPIDTVKGRIIDVDEHGVMTIKARYDDWHTLTKRQYSECLIQMIDGRPLDKTKPVKLTKSQQNALQMAIKAERFFY